MRLLDGRTAVVTGGAQGIGLQIAAQFAEHGARVVIGDIDRDAAVAAAEHLADRGLAVRGTFCDVVNETSVDELVAGAAAWASGIDIFVNNAGFTRDNVLRKMTRADFIAVVEVHLLGAWLGLRSAVASMRETGSRGTIINLSSISGKVGNPGQTNYSAAKAGVVGLTKAASKEVARYGIRVNAIQPGVIEGAMTAVMPPNVLRSRIEEIPLGRIGNPADVAGAAVFLASDLSSYVTGTVLEVAGGRHV